MQATIVQPVVRKRRARRWLAVSLAVLLCGFVYVWFFVPPKTAKAPFRLERSANGQFQRVGDESNSRSRMDLAVHAGGLQARNGTSSSSMSSNSEPAYFRARSVMVSNFSDHLLMKRVGEELVELLKTVREVERIEYFPQGHAPAAGGETPDLFVSLDLRDIQESGIVGRTLHAQVGATFGTSLVASNNHVHDSLSPPVMELNTKIEVDHNSTFTGVESSAAQYQQQAKNIAEQLADSITKMIKSTREKHESPTDVPTAFYPPYRETPQLEFLGHVSSEQLGSFHGLMCGNETYWKLAGTSDVPATLTAVRNSMKQAGWETDGNEGNEESRTHLRMTRMQEALEVFMIRDSATGFVVDGASIPDVTPETVRLFARYRNRLGRDEIASAFEVLLSAARPDNLEFLIAMRRYANTEQNKRLMALVEAHPPDSCTGLSALAELYVERKDKEAAARTLRRLHHVAVLDDSDRNAEEFIKTQAKTLDLDAGDLSKYDPAIFKALGFATVESNSQSEVINAPINKMIKFFVKGVDGKWSVCGARITPANPDRFDVQLVRWAPGSGRMSTTERNTDFTPPITRTLGADGETFGFDIVPQSNNSFRVTLKSVIEKAASPQP